jgi:hypothetical protein
LIRLSEHPRSFHPCALRSTVHAMTTTTTRGGRGRKPQSNRLTTCAFRSCSRLFAVCGGCDRGRRFCSPQCSSSARRSSLQRAGRQYQATDRGRSLHAARQARYRDRLRTVTHQSRDSDQKKASNGEKRPLPQRGTAAARPELCLPPVCAFCHRTEVFLRNGFLDRTPRRKVEQSRPPRVRSARVRHGQAIRAACAWAFEVPGGNPVGARKRSPKRPQARPADAAPTRPIV